MLYDLEFICSLLTEFFLEFDLEKYDQLLRTTRQILSTQNRMTETLNKLVDQMNSIPTSKYTDSTIFGLPLATCDSLRAAENSFKQDKEYREALVSVYYIKRSSTQM